MYDHPGYSLRSVSSNEENSSNEEIIGVERWFAKQQKKSTIAVVNV